MSILLSPWHLGGGERAAELTEAAAQMYGSRQSRAVDMTSDWLAYTEGAPTLTAIPSIIDNNVHRSMCIWDIQHSRVVYTEISGIGKEAASTCLPRSMSIDERYINDLPTI
jgi:hypothetical protein